MKRAFLLLLFLLAPATGCNRNSLDRERAKRLIEQQSLNYRLPHSMSVHAGTTGGFCPATTKNDSFLVLERLGLVEIQTGGGDLRVRRTDRFTKVLPDATLRPQDAGPLCRYELWIFTTANKEMVEVTGIVRESETVALVEYHWKWKPSNIVGEALLEESSFQKELSAEQVQILRADRLILPHDNLGRARLLLYDDGWRLDQDYDRALRAQELREALSAVTSP